MMNRNITNIWEAELPFHAGSASFSKRFESPSTAPRSQAIRKTPFALPEELLLLIAEAADQNDICSLRLTNKTLARVGATALQNKLQCLYLHPSQDSLALAVEVCNNTYRNKNITKITILGRWIGKTEHNYHWPPSYLAATQGHLFGGAINSFVRQKLGYYSGRFVEAYDELLQALRKLPALRTVAYAPRAGEPGFCRLSSKSIGRLARERKCCREFWTAGHAANESTFRFTDAEAFFGILGSLPRLKSVDHESQRLHIDEHVRWYNVGFRHPDSIGWPATSKTPKLLAENISTVALTLDTRPYPQHWSPDEVLEAKLLSVCPRLQHLDLKVAAKRQSRPERAAPLFDERVLRIIEGIDSDAPLQSLQIDASGGLFLLLHGPDILVKLLSLKGTLRILRLLNLSLANEDIFVDPDLPPDPTNGITEHQIEIHCEQFRDDFELEIAQWRVRATSCGRMLGLTAHEGWYDFGKLIVA